MALADLLTLARYYATAPEPNRLIPPVPAAIGVEPRFVAVEEISDLPGPDPDLAAGTRRTPDQTFTGHDPINPKTHGFRGSQVGGTRRTRGTREKDDVWRKCGNDRPENLPLPTAAVDLLAHVREILGCRVTLEAGDILAIRPAHWCPPPALAAVLTVLAEVRCILRIEAGALAALDGATRNHNGGRRRRAR